MKFNIDKEIVGVFLKWDDTTLASNAGLVIMGVSTFIESALSAPMAVLGIILVFLGVVKRSLEIRELILNAKKRKQYKQGQEN